MMNHFYIASAFDLNRLVAANLISHFHVYLHALYAPIVHSFYTRTSHNIYIQFTLFVEYIGRIVQFGCYQHILRCSVTNEPS